MTFINAKYNKLEDHLLKYGKITVNREFNYMQANAQVRILEYIQKNANSGATMGIKFGKRSVTLYFAEVDEKIADIILEALGDVTDAFAGSIARNMKEVEYEVNRTAPYYVEQIDAL